MAAALLPAAVAPAVAGAASWGPVRDATKAGRAFSPAVAADADGRLTIGYTRQLGGADGRFTIGQTRRLGAAAGGDRRDAVHRVEVRRGFLHTGLHGAGRVLDASSEEVSSLAITQSAEGLLAAAWLRHEDRAQGPRAATVALDGEVTGPANLVPDGTESAFDPRWVAPPPGRLSRAAGSRASDRSAAEGGLTGLLPVAGWARPPLLVWDRRTSSAAAPLNGTSFGPPGALPGDGLSSQVSVVEEQSGARVAVWSDGTRVLGATAAAGAAFGEGVPLSGPGVARDPQLATDAEGVAVAAWVRSEGAGNVLEVALRRPGGAFTAPVALSDPEEGAFAPRLIAAADGGWIVTWISGPTDRGWGSVRGPLRMRRLTADGAPASDAVTLTPAGVRTTEATLAYDEVRGAVFIGWSSGLLANRQIGVRRLTRAGRLGPVRRLAAGRWELTGAPVLAAAAGGAVMAWAADGVVRYCIYD